MRPNAVRYTGIGQLEDLQGRLHQTRAYGGRGVFGIPNIAMVSTRYGLENDSPIYCGNNLSLDCSIPTPEFASLLTGAHLPAEFSRLIATGQAVLKRASDRGWKFVRNATPA